MKTQNKFYWDVIFLSAGILWGIITGIDILYYLNGWDYWALGGIGKLILVAAIAPVAISFFTVRKLLRKKGFCSFAEIVTHFILIAFIAGLLSGSYWYIFENHIDPNYRIEIAEFYYKGLQKNLKEIHDLDKKKEFIEFMNKQKNDIEMMKNEKTLVQTYYHYTVIRYIGSALFYGVVFGFIFSKIYVSTDEDNNDQIETNNVLK